MKLPKWYLVFYLFPLVSIGQIKQSAIQLNQVGFYVNGPKLGIITGDVTDSRFYIVSSDNKDTVYTGLLSEQKKSAFSSTKTRQADFSSLQKQGNYFVFVPGVGNSYNFAIDNFVIHKAAIASLKAFYFIRSDFPLEEKYAGKWNRPPGHPDTSVLIHASAADELRPEAKRISTPGGWYDAGDYNKYVVNSGITMGTLLSAYEDFASYFRQLNTNIPESSDSVPDILNEVVYNLRWMLTMQDPNDGGVYHKCTNAAFDGMVMPGITKAPRYVVQKSTAATLDFTAVTAQAGRILRDYEGRFPHLADSCLSAAAIAWKWALKNPSHIYNQKEINSKYDPDITTGEYGDRHLNDEWMWAAAELFVSTKNMAYYEMLMNQMKEPAILPSWANVSMLAYYSLIKNSKSLPDYTAPIVHQMKDSVLKIANAYISKMKMNAFATVIGQSAKDFIWGSNAVAANQGILLINAYSFSNDKRYLNGAISNLDYLLGRNATGYCFLTDIGSKSPMHPHHRPSEADGITDPVPGLLVGGPNPGRQDNCTYPFMEPETSYVDSACSYASNEIAINWNAPMVYLTNALEAIFNSSKMNSK